MFKTVEKSLCNLSIIFTLSIFTSLFFLPGATRLLSLIVMGLGILAIVIFTVHRHAQARKHGRVTCPAMTRNIVIDLLGILITMVLVILAAGKLGPYTGQMASKAWGVPVGILSGVGAGLMTGLGIGLFVRWGWGKLTKPKRVGSATPA